MKNARQHHLLLSLCLSLLSALVPTARMQKESAKATVQTKGGLQIVTFDTPNGQVIVNLPDDLMAGDTISGTVVEEPKGNAPQEKERNKAVLDGLVIDLEGAKVPATTTRFTWLPPAPSGSTPVQYHLKIVPALPQSAQLNSNPSAVITAYPRIIPTTSTTPAASDFHIPMIGQQGRPIEIIGPFDGNSSNTVLNWTQMSNAAQDFEKNTEKVSSGFGLIPIAESPRKCIFTAPANVAGPIEIHLKEGNVEKKSEYRNVGVNLTAPKTSLLKGESTTLTINVTGLQGIKQNVPLQLVKSGVVSMEGGDVQTKTIEPGEVKRDGTYRMTRKITGQQAGAFNVTATVVVFDICLQGDKSGDSLMFSSGTGDYIFCEPGSRTNAVKPANANGAGSVVRNGCIITLQHDAPDRRVQAQIDRCTQTANATVQFGPGKTTFTITDRDAKNNTCPCGGGPTSLPQATNPAPANQPDATPSPQPSPTTSPQAGATPPPQPGGMTADECVEQAMEVERLKDEINKKERELAGIPAEKAKTAAELSKCKRELEEATQAQKQAADELAKQEKRKKNIENNTGPGKQFPDKDAARKNFGDYEKDYDDAKKAKDDADKEVADAQKKCDDLKKKLDDLGKKEKSLPGEIEGLKKKLEEAEKKLSEWKAAEEKKKKDEEEKKRKTEEDRRRTEAEKAATDARSQAETGQIKYLLNNIKSLGLISSDAFWQSQPENNNHLIELLKKSAGDLAEEFTNTPIPLDTLDAIKGLYGVVGALLDPCTTDGKRKTVERLQNRVNSKTGRNYTLDEALDKTDSICELLQKLKALASKK
jgi:hypothetical protein